jgi:transcription antitermination factor NusG
MMEKACHICGRGSCKEHVAHWGPDWTWYALRVAPGRELATEARLRDADHFTFVPLRHPWAKQRRGVKRKVLSARAQYPGYVFIGFPPGFAAPWKSICEIDGVLGPVGRDGEPMPILERTMTAMLAGTRRPINYVQVKASRRRKSKGQNTAEIVSGPYQGRTVRVIETENDDPELYELFKAAA